MRINGAALREIRKRSGLSIAKLSEASGVDRSVISRIERGERRGTPRQHVELAQALGCTLVAIGAPEAAA